MARKKRPSKPRHWTTREAAERAADKLRAAYGDMSDPQVRQMRSGNWTVTMNWRRSNPGVTTSGWVKAKAVKIVRNKRGQAVSVKIRT